MSHNTTIVRSASAGRATAIVSTDGEWFYFVACKMNSNHTVGTELGKHRLAVEFTDEQRLQAHWEGFCRNYGIFIFQPQVESALNLSATDRNVFNAITGSVASWEDHLKDRY